MKILRIIRGEPYEFALTPYERHTLFAEMNLEYAKENINWALKTEANNDNTHAAIMLRNLNSNPLFMEKVAMHYNEILSDLSQDQDYSIIVKDAYDYVINSEALGVN